jgi:hypothetical protein
MKKKLIVGLLSFQIFSAVALTAAPFAHACSCTEPKGPQEELGTAHAVFTGQASRVKQNIFQRLFGTTQIEFTVHQSWKGVDQKKITMKTSANTTACGYHFEEGKDYLVYANGNEGSTISSCSRTKLVSQAGEDIKALGESQKSFLEVEDQVDESNTFLYISIGGALATILIPSVLAIILPRKRKAPVS